MSKLSDLPLQALTTVGQSLGKYLERGSAELHYARKMFEAGALKLEPPQDIAAFVADMRRWGEIGMIPALNARRYPNRNAVIDDFGEFTFKELDDAVNAVANGLLAKGVKGGDWVRVWSKRGSIKAKALVTKRIRPLNCDGRVVHVVGIPLHWGFVGAAKKGWGPNSLTPFVGDANIETPEFKAFLVNIEPAVGEAVS